MTGSWSMEKDEAGISPWIDVVTQELVAERGEQQLVYVVTESPPAIYSWIHDLYLRLVKISDKPEVEMLDMTLLEFD